MSKSLQKNIEGNVEVTTFDEENWDDDLEAEDLEFVDIEFEMVDLKNNNGIISIGDMMDALIRIKDGKITVYNTSNLSEHIRCASHLLALLASADFFSFAFSSNIQREVRSCHG